MVPRPLQKLGGDSETPCVHKETLKPLVLIDNGSTLNVCLMATLEHLKVDMSLIKPSTMIIRIFDGTCCEVQGKKIELMIEISPRCLMVNFQVIKVDSPYNML